MLLSGPLDVILSALYMTMLRHRLEFLCHYDEFIRTTWILSLDSSTANGLYRILSFIYILNLIIPYSIPPAVSTGIR